MINQTAYGPQNMELEKKKLWLAKKIEKSIPKTDDMKDDPKVIQLIKDRYQLARQSGSLSQRHR